MALAQAPIAKMYRSRRPTADQQGGDDYSGTAQAADSPPLYSPPPQNAPANNTERMFPSRVPLTSAGAASRQAATAYARANVARNAPPVKAFTPGGTITIGDGKTSLPADIAQRLGDAGYSGNGAKLSMQTPDRTRMPAEMADVQNSRLAYAAAEEGKGDIRIAPYMGPMVGLDRQNAQNVANADQPGANAYATTAAADAQVAGAGAGAKDLQRMQTENQQLRQQLQKYLSGEQKGDAAVEVQGLKNEGAVTVAGVRAGATTQEAGIKAGATTQSAGIAADANRYGADRRVDAADVTASGYNQRNAANNAKSEDAAIQKIFEGLPDKDGGGNAIDPAERMATAARLHGIARGTDRSGAPAATAAGTPSTSGAATGKVIPHTKLANGSVQLPSGEIYDVDPNDASRMVKRRAPAVQPAQR